MEDENFAGAGRVADGTTQRSEADDFARREPHRVRCARPFVCIIVVDSGGELQRVLTVHRVVMIFYHFKRAFPRATGRPVGAP